MLPAVDMDLGAVHVRARLRAQHVNDLGHLVGRAQALQRNLLDDLLGAGRQNRGVDLARRDRVDANAEAAEVARHLARERGERRLRGSVGRAGERVHARAGNGGDVHHRALDRLQFVHQSRASMIGAKKLTWNTWRHTSAVVSSEPSRLPPSPLGEIAALFTSACSSWPSIRRLISSMAERVLASSARLTWT